MVINLNQGIGGNLGFELPEGNKVYIPSRLRLKTPFELYLEMQRMRYADGSPLLSGDQSPVFPKDPGEFGYVDPFTGPLVSWWDLLDAMDLTHQDQPARGGSGYQVYDPQRAYMDRGGGGGGNSSDPTGQSTKPCIEAFNNCSKKYCGSAPLSKLYDIIRKFFKEYAFEAWVSTGGIGKAVAVLIKTAKIKGAGLWGLQVAVLSFVLYWTYYSPACVTFCFMGYLHCEYTAWRKANKS